MGSNFSRNPNPNSSTNIADIVTSYESACRSDADLRSFDAAVHNRTAHVISAVADFAGSDTISFDTLRDVTGCLLDTSQEVVKIILQCRSDVWSCPDLFELVEDYFDSSLKTLDFITSLEKSLNRARDSQLIIQLALKQFSEENSSEANDRTPGEHRFTKTLEELRHFKSSGNPFTEEFFDSLKLVYIQQVSMLQKLQNRKRKLDKKLKNIKSWRKISSMIFVSAFAAVIICSVVAAVVAAPPVAAALAAAATVPLGSTGKWIDSLWKKYAATFKAEKEVMDTMYVGTYVAIRDLDGIRVLVERLEGQIGNLIRHAEFAVGEEDEVAVKMVMEEIEKKVEGFMKSIDDLGEQADQCSRNIGRARTVVLQRIIRQPS